MTDHDYELMNEIRDRDHAEFEEVCRHEQAEAEAAAEFQEVCRRMDEKEFEMYLEKQRLTPGTLVHDATQLEIRTMRVVIDCHQSLLMRLQDDIRLLRRQVRVLQDWKDSTHAFQVQPALRDEEEEWKASMREGMV